MKNVGLIHTNAGVTLLIDGKSKTVSSTDERYNAVVKAWGDQDEDALRSAITPVAEKVKKFVGSSEGFEYGAEILYQGKPLHNVLVDKIKTMVKQNAPDVAPLKAFLERLYKNVSAASINELYTFLEYKELPITPDGYFLAYRGVSADYYSKHGNTATRVKQGVVDKAGRILNSIGATIEVDRNQVDDNRERHCSFGLHVGSYDYANSWAGTGGRVLLVKVDPADVVSVPNDCNCQKARVSKYEVLSEFAEEVKAAVVTQEQAKKPQTIQKVVDVQVNPNLAYADRVKKYLSRKKENGYNSVTLREVQGALSPASPALISILDIVKAVGYKVNVDKKTLGNSYVKLR